MIETVKQGSVDVLRPADRLDADAVPELSRAVDAVLGQGRPQLVIDLKGVALVDGAALECLLDARDRCLRRGGACKLCGPSPLCREVLRITGVSEEIEIFSDVVSAAGSFAQ